MDSTLKTYTSGKDIMYRSTDDFIFHKIDDQDDFLKFKIKVSGRYEKLSLQNKREEIVFRAVGNLIKQNNFLKLHIELLSEQISESEYENELENRSDHYFVELKPIESAFEYLTLVDIIEKFPKNSFSVDEFSDIFGITHEGFGKNLHLP